MVFYVSVGYNLRISISMHPDKPNLPMYYKYSNNLLKIKGFDKVFFLIKM